MAWKTRNIKNMRINKEITKPLSLLAQCIMRVAEKLCESFL